MKLAKQYIPILYEVGKEAFQKQRPKLSDRVNILPFITMPNYDLTTDLNALGVLHLANGLCKEVAPSADYEFFLNWLSQEYNDKLDGRLQMEVIDLMRTELNPVLA